MALHVDLNLELSPSMGIVQWYHSWAESASEADFDWPSCHVKDQILY